MVRWRYILTTQDKGAGAALIRVALDLADNWLNLRRLELLVYADNPAAIGLYQKYGFAAAKLHAEDSMGEIYMVAVDPDFQGQGIGSALIEFALS